MFATHATSLYVSLYVSFNTVLPQQILFADISFNNPGYNLQISDNTQPIKNVNIITLGAVNNYFTLFSF